LVCLICFYLYWCPLRSSPPPSDACCCCFWGWEVRRAVPWQCFRWNRTTRCAHGQFCVGSRVRVSCGTQCALLSHVGTLSNILARQVFVGSRGNSNNLLYRKKEGGGRLYSLLFTLFVFFFSYSAILLIACLYLSYFFVGYAWIISRQFLCLQWIWRGLFFFHKCIRGILLKGFTTGKT
jgi:hypothetical protein